jgi:membrane-associated protease RseP (regulator of RpoE activity)
MRRAVYPIAAAFCALLFAHPAIANTTDERPWLGVSFNTGQHYLGVSITEVIPDTPAEDAGFVAGDYIVSVDGVSLTDGTQLSAVIQSKQVGDDIVVQVLRGSKDVVINVTLERFPTADEILYKRMVGKTAPSLNIEIVSGTASTSELAGRVLLIEMFATHSNACEPTHAELSKLANSHTDDDLVVLAVADELRSTLSKWGDGADWYHNIARTFSDSTWVKYQMGGNTSETPTIYVVDEKGTIIFAGIGADRLQEATFIAERAVRKKNKR